MVRLFQVAAGTLSLWACRKRHHFHTENELISIFFCSGSLVKNLYEHTYIYIYITIYIYNYTYIYIYLYVCIIHIKELSNMIQYPYVSRLFSTIQNSADLRACKAGVEAAAPAAPGWRCPEGRGDAWCVLCKIMGNSWEDHGKIHIFIGRYRNIMGKSLEHPLKK